MNKVLILIVLEDALWEILVKLPGIFCLVLILIVLEDALWGDNKTNEIDYVIFVLILIVLEDALWAGIMAK